MPEKLSDKLDTSATNPATGEQVDASDTIDYAKFVFYGLAAFSVGAFAFNWVRNQVNEISGQSIGGELGGIAGGL